MKFIKKHLDKKMSLVPYFKAGLLLSHKSNRAGIPPLVAVKEGNIILRNECMGVAMTQDTHTTLATLNTEFMKHEASFIKEFPDQYLIAITELMHDIQSTGEVPSVDLNARPQRRHVPLDLDDFDDDMEDEEDEDEFLPNESDEEVVNLETKMKATSKPIPKEKKPKVEKKVQAKSKGQTKEVNEEVPVVEEPVPVAKKRGGGRKKKVEEGVGAGGVGALAREDVSKPVDPAQE